MPEMIEEPIAIQNIKSYFCINFMEIITSYATVGINPYQMRLKYYIEK